METDRLFKQIKRQSERELYRQSFRQIRQSEKDLIEKLTDQKKEMRRTVLARELLWFFLTLVIAPISAFLIFYALVNGLPETFKQMVQTFGATDMFFYVLLGTCFVGVYISRMVVWSLKKLSS